MAKMRGEIKKENAEDGGTAGNTRDGDQLLRRLYVSHLQHQSVAGFLD